MVQTPADRGDDAGFTLVELVISILILGVIAGIALYGVGEFSDDATAACTKSNSRIDASVSAANALSSPGTYSSTGGPC